jgi:glyoxylase-like metal-dependent hydrolase (beta-lactamase superfamily II)
MYTHPNRREFLQSVLAAGAGVGLTGLLPRSAQARSDKAAISSTRLNDHLVVFSGAGANVVAAHSPDGVLLIDGGLPERSADLLDAVYRETGSKRVQVLINTHWHPEQTGSNETLGKAGAKIIAHENTRRWLEYAQTEPGHERPYGPLSAKGRPTDTLISSINLSKADLQFAGEKVEYGYLLQAHTDGDLYVFFRDSNVMVGGGVLSNEGWPVIDYETGGWIGGLVDGLRSLDGLVDEKTRIVPANGPLMSREELQAQRQMYATVFDRLGKLLRKGMGPEEALAAAPTKEFDPKWGDPRQFTDLAFRSLWGHFAPDA